MQFSRLVSLIGDANFKILKNASILVIGLGGVGSYVVEALARSGIENFILVDFDTIDITNINRQIMANLNNIGCFKTDEIEKRIFSINKDANVIKINEFITKENISILGNYSIDFFIDCCDTISTKQEIILFCLKNGIKLISSMGMGNRLYPEKLVITDIRNTSYDPVARKIRYFINKNNILDKITVCTSTEIPIKNKMVASNSFVPSSAGILIASFVFNSIIDL